MWPFRKKDHYTQAGRVPVAHLRAWPGQDISVVIWLNSDDQGRQIMKFSIRKKRKPTAANKLTYTCTFSAADLLAVSICANKARRWYRQMKKAGVVR